MIFGLEYGADKPRDIEILKVVAPDIGVITHTKVHRQGTKLLRCFEGKEIDVFGQWGVAILNGDDENLKK